MDDWKLIGGMFLLTVFLFACAFISPSISDGLQPEDIYVEQFVCEVTNYSNVYSNGEIDERYVYSVKFDLKNVSNSLEGSKFVTYLYDNNTLITTDDEYNENTTLIEDVGEFNSLHGYHKLWINHYVVPTHCDLVIIKDGKVVFNETKPFYMGNYEDSSYIESTSDNNDKSEDISTKDTGSTFVASSNSNKFHEPYCSQAKRINDANKITFSSRDEAINAGYEPCEICYP